MGYHASGLRATPSPWEVNGAGGAPLVMSRPPYRFRVRVSVRVRVRPRVRVRRAVGDVEAAVCPGAEGEGILPHEEQQVVLGEG